MSTLIVAFPFDIFGSAGAGAGAQLLADAIREMLADNRREKQPSRAQAYHGQVRIREISFETIKSVADWRKDAKQLARTALRRGDFLIWLGGNHLSVLPVLEELGTMANSLAVQFDAHLDVYNLADCTTELSHGNFLLHAAEPLPPIVHVGHRDLFLPADYLAKHFAAAIPAEEIAVHPDEVALRLKELASKEKVWIDIDCDIFDPAYFPATGHALPFGLPAPTMLQLLEAVWSDRIAGVSISEFEPARDRNDQSLGLLVWLLEWLLLKRYERPGRQPTNVAFK